MQVIEGNTKKKKIIGERSCKDCAHVKVCTIFKSLTKGLMLQFLDEDKPVDAEDLAVICKAFLSINIVMALDEETAKYLRGEK